VRFRRRVALIVAVLTATLITPAARALDLAAAPTAVTGGPLSGGADLAEALRLERAVDWHLWYRQAYEINYADATREAGAAGPDPSTRYPGIVRIGGMADSALWTGTYLASQAFRYQVASHHLAGHLTGPDRKFWTAQREEALARVRPLVDQYHLLTHISKEWKWTDEDEAAHEPGVSSDGKIVDLGTAPFKEAGEGLLFRSCIPMGSRLFPWHPHLDADGKPNGIFDEDRVYGPFSWSEPGSSTTVQYACEDGTSRDAYAGTSFGMATAFDFIAREDLWTTRADGTRENLHDQLGSDLRLMTKFLLDHNWTTPRPHSKVSTSNDLSSFISPLFVTSSGGRQHLLQIARHVSAVMGSPDAGYFQSAWEEEMAKNGYGNTFGSIVDTTSPTDSYYKWNLGHLTGYGLLRLEPKASASERDRLRAGFGILDASTRDDVNAHFETITYALTGETARRDAAIEHLRQWRSYRAKLDHPTSEQIASGRVVIDNYAVCNDPGVAISPAATCKPEDKYQSTAYESTPAGTVQLPPGYPVCNAATRDAQPSVTGPCRSVMPLAVATRTPTDFLWQRSPFDLDGAQAVTAEAPGFDYLLPYWMLRYYTEVAPPTTVEPFPAWVGPTYQ
jgi:hypothetical protein